MHPILENKERLTLYMAAWLVIAGLLCLLLTTMNAMTWAEAGFLVAPMSLVYAFMCLASLYVCRAFPLPQTAFLKILSVVFVASTLTASVWLLVGKGIGTILTRLEFIPQLDTKFDGSIPLLFGIGMLLFMLAAVVHYLLLAFDSAREAERHALELQVLAREAELKALRAQIQPHFLFNSLNSISALTATDPSAARAMALRLAEFFRRTLKLGQEQFVPLAEEFQLAEHFLAIEQIRFGKRLSFRKEIEKASEGVSVPSLILQPIIENAIRHGIAHLIEGGEIILSARRNGTSLSINISNPCDTDQPKSSSTGVGLANVRRRLDALYGNDANLSINSTSAEFSVELVIPLKNPDANI